MLKGRWIGLILVGLCVVILPVGAQEPPGEAVRWVQDQLKKELGQSPEPVQVVKLLNRMTVTAYQKGKYELGLEIAKQALSYAEQTLGPAHPDTLSSVNNLAELYRVQSCYGEAEPLFKRVLAAREKVLGPDHLQTLTSVNNLAMLYQAQGHYGDAEPLYRRALAASEKGLALAGANQGLQDHLNAAGEDGILYSLEVQGLNLEGTELVTLSACDTGKGTMDYSEGVYGLVRAFRAAGARHVLMALQSVNDAKAKDFMLSFYERWLNANLSDPAKALRETQLSFIREKENPNVWASFVLVETRHE